MKSLRQVGAHTIEVIDDLVIATSRGHWDLAQLEVLIATWESVLRAEGRLYYIGDFSQGMELPSQGRRRVVDWAKTHEVAAIALCINSLPVRALSTLVLRAARLVRSLESTEPYFCSTLTEAKAHIAAERQRLLMQHSP